MRCQQLCQHFYGVNDTFLELENYVVEGCLMQNDVTCDVSESTVRPLVLHGHAGSGKSTQMAQVRGMLATTGC